MPEPAISFDKFSHTYEDGTKAVEDISFSVSTGASVGLIGHNGSGKTTLFMHIVGILEPDCCVKVCGLPVTKSNLKEIRKKVGYVFQDPRDQLFMSTVAEDVAFGPLNSDMTPHDAIHKVEYALESVGLQGFGHRISYHLSGGEMRRAAIATVLAMSPEIIVMDEPSSGLDPRAKRELATLINGLDCTKLISSHDLEFIRKCTDSVILLNKGKVAAVGQTQEILGNMELLLSNGL
ncbi:energy-coupling factor ABC transporter ATP-binding protein [Candidatus Latescibacterota bacterium]